MRLAILGAGGIASDVMNAIRKDVIQGVVPVGIAGTKADSERARRLSEEYRVRHVSASDLSSLGPDWILEAAGTVAVSEYGPEYLASGINMIVMSVGGLLDAEAARHFRQATARGIRVVIPSGAIGGLDVIRSLGAVGGLEEVSIKTTKSPDGLAGAPFLKANGITLPAVGRITVFCGSAREAVLGFPENVNVAAALSLCGIGPERTMVTIVSDSTARRTRHEVLARGDAGVLRLRIEAFPSARNPRTSRLAALSAIACLQDASSQFAYGPQPLQL